MVSQCIGLKTVETQFVFLIYLLIDSLRSSSISTVSEYLVSQVRENVDQSYNKECIINFLHNLTLILPY